MSSVFLFDVVCILRVRLGSLFWRLELNIPWYYRSQVTPSVMISNGLRRSFRRSTKQYICRYACRLCGKQCDSDTGRELLPRRHFSSETHISQHDDSTNEQGIIFEGGADDTPTSACHTLHTPVLLREVLQVIQPKNDQVWINGTFN